tara:strand:- start:417 stop:1046 length:630 start_codon:yes stop_codon:yes gene_type:complete
MSVIAPSGIISLGTTAGTNRSISGEFGGSGSHALSEYYSGGSNVPSGSADSDGNVIPTSSTIKFSDFHGTPFPQLVHSSTVVTGYQSSQYFSVSGYLGNLGSMSDTTISSFNGKSNVTIEQCVRTGSTGSEKLTLKVNKNNETISNAGFTSIKIYMNQSSAGTVTITRDRANATYSFANGSATWQWDDVTLAQAFGSTVGQTNFMELTP